jgi:hypothetical protein
MFFCIPHIKIRKAIWGFAEKTVDIVASFDVYAFIGNLLSDFNNRLRHTQVFNLDARN